MIRKVLAPFLILFAFQALVRQGSSQNFCNVYLPFQEEVFSSCTATGTSSVGPYTATDIPELATATAFTVSFYYYNLVETFPTNSNDFVFLFQLSDQSTDSPSTRWLQAYYSAANLYINHQTDSVGSTLVNHTASPAVVAPFESWILIHVEFDASASQIYLFSTDFATFLYQNTVTTTGATVTPMGSNGQLFFGCMNGVVDMSCTCGQIARPIFAPYSMKVAPYDTFAFQFNVNAISWYRFDNTGSPGTAQDYTTTAPANIGGYQPNFPSYTLGEEENGFSFSATNMIILPTIMNYRPYPPTAYYAVETFIFWLNILIQTSNPAIIFTRYDSTNSIKYQIALDTTNTVKVFIVGNSYFSSTLTIPASTWTLLIVSFKTLEVSAFMAPSGYWQATFPINQSLLHQSTDTEYLGSTTSSFVGYLREFRVFSDSSLVNFVSTEFSTCLSGCTYGIGFNTLINAESAPICLDPSTAPTCPSGQSLFSNNNNCYNCYHQCSACTGLSATDCNPCDASQGLYLQPNNYCSTTCPTTYYPDTSTQTCESCIANCDVCSNAASCTTCTSPYYLSQVDSLCYLSCPTGTCLNPAECDACPSNCKACSSGTVCTTCATGYYLSQVNSQCYATCPTATYTNSLYCSACPSNCNVCLNAAVCITCAGGFYLDQASNQCYSTCPTGTYSNSPYCSACPLGCSTCSSGTACTSCTSNLYLSQVDSVCYFSTCPAGTYLNPPYCSACPSNCNSCSSGSVCTTCAAGYYLDQANSVCYSTCPTGTYLNSPYCTPCQPGCSACLSPSVCTTCAGGYYLDQATNQCYSTCPTGTYLSSPYCSACPSNCNACSSGTACTSCTSGYYLSQVDSLCYSTCPAGTYLNPPHCSACPSNCNSCSSGSVCTTCAAGYYLDQTNSLCYSTCPTGMYLNSLYCSACPSNCNACSSGSVCITCAGGFYLDQASNQCYSTCPTGTYLNSPYCSACPSNCNACSSGTACTSCTSGFYFSQVDSLCYSSTCHTGTYLNPPYCSACPSNCNSCYSGSVCTTCAAGYHLDQANSVCYSTCPTGTYVNSMYCSPCQLGCNVCSNAAVCTTCAGGFYLDQANNQCYSTCPTGTYLSSPYCSTCPSNCNVCSSGGICTSCTSGYYLSQVDSLCYFSTCPTGTYFNSPFCSACPSNCNVCSSGAACITCAGGYSLDQANSLCYSTCPTGAYLNSPYCGACPSNCNVCSSGTVCTTCVGGYLLSQVDNQCYSSCPAATYTNSQNCIACSSNCAFCYSSTACTTCSASYYLSQVDYSCYSSCPSGTYTSETSCLACSSNCNSCWSSTACSACQTNYYLYNDGATQSCYSSCPTGYLADPATSTCTVSCEAGEYNNGDGFCAQCVQYCTSCSDATSCNSCSGGRSFKNGTCVLPSSCVTSTCTLTLSLTLTPDPLGFELVFNQQVQPIIDSLSAILVVQLGDRTCSNSEYYLQTIDSESAIIRFPTDEPIPSTTTLYCQVNLPSTLTVNFTQVNNNASITVAQYIPLSASQITTANMIGTINNYGGKIATGFIVISQISVMSTGTLLFAAFGSDMIQMYRYVNVRYPENCLVVFNASLTSAISITIPIDLSSFQSAANAIGYYENIEDGKSLERYGVNRYFLNNFQDCISTIILLLILCGLLHFVLRYKKKLNRKIVSVLDKAYIFLCWNFTIASAFSYSIKLYFYSTVYMWYLNTKTANGIVNIVASIIIIPMSIALLVYTIKYLKKVKSEELREPGEYGLTGRYKRLYGGVKHDTAAKKFYVPVLVIRAMIFGLLLSVMRNAVLPQAILFCIMNTGFLVYIIIARASEITIEMMSHVVTECVMSGISYSILALAVIDADNPENQGIRSRIGMAIIVLNFILIGVQAIISGRAMFSALKQLIRGIINARRRRFSIVPLKSKQTNREALNFFGEGIGISDLTAAQESEQKPKIDISQSPSLLDGTKVKEPALADGSPLISPPIDILQSQSLLDGSKVKEPALADGFPLNSLPIDIFQSQSLLDGSKVKEPALADGSPLISPLARFKLRTIERKKESRSIFLYSPENSPMNSNNRVENPLLKRVLARTTINQGSNFDKIDVLGSKISMETTNFNLKEENGGDETPTVKKNSEKIVD